MKKQSERFKNAHDTINDYHHALWPGVAVNLLRVKFSKNESDQHDQKSWLERKTIPTSWLIAYVVYRLNFKFGNKLDRSVAWKATSGLLSTLLAQTGPFTVPHIRWGDDEQADLHVDAQGNVSCKDVWTGDFFRSTVSRRWKADRKDDGKPWVRTIHEIDGKIPFLDLLTFSLDPQHSADFQGRVLGRAYTLFTHLAGMLDDKLVSLSSRGVPITNVKKRKRTSSSITRAQISQAAHQLWSGRDI